MSLLDDLLHWWELDTTGWLDSHGSWNLTNRTAVTITATGGPDGGPAAFFDGSHYLDRTNVAWDGSGAARSIQIWGYYTSLSSTGNWLINQRTNLSPLNYQLLFSTNYAFPRGNVWDSATVHSSIIYDEDLSQSPNQWYHLLITTNGVNRHKFYVNGVERGRSTVAQNGAVTGNALPFAIGTAWIKGDNTLRHRGRACMAGIWQRELSESDAVRLYNGGAGRRYAALESKSIIPLLRQYHATMKD